MNKSNNNSIALLKLLFLLLICSFSAYSQRDNHAIDSATITGADWHIVSKEGVSIGYHEFDYLFGEPQAFFVVIIPSSEIYRLHLAADTVLTTVSEQAKRLNASLAINGTFFDMDSVNTFPVCYLRIDNNELGINTTPLSGDTTQRKYFQYATLVLDADTIGFIVPDSARFYERHLPHANIMTAGPMLLWDGKMVPQRNDRTFVTHRHNRTAIGIRHDGSVILLVADGRFPKYAAGLSLHQLALAMQWLGCYQAMNLDGGGSSTLYVDGDEFNNTDGVVNHPSDNNKLDHMGQRDVANIIYLARPSKKQSNQ